MEEKKELSLKELDSWCLQFSQKLKAKTLVLLDGPLGAGKTLLVQKTVKALAGGLVSSPTYSLINEYTGNDRIKKIFHIDLYRLIDGEDLESTGFWDLFTESDAIVFIEWSEKLNKDELPLDWKIVEIKIEKSLSSESRYYYCNFNSKT